MTQLGSMTEITDHFDQAVAKIRQRFQDKPIFLALLESYIKQVQELESATWDVIRTRFLDVTDDFHTERLGRLVGQPRRGESLSKYKLYISARILVNRSLARAQDILQIARVLLLTQGPNYDEGGANFVLTARTELDAESDPEVLVEMVKQAKAAGVGFVFIYPTVIPTLAFTYTSESPTLNPTEGWGSTTESTGGKWSSAIDGRITGYIT